MSNEARAVATRVPREAARTSLAPSTSSVETSCSAATRFSSPLRQVAKRLVHASTVNVQRPMRSTRKAAYQRSLSKSYVIGVVAQSEAPGPRNNTRAARMSWPSFTTSAPTTTVSPTMRFTGWRPPSSVGVTHSMERCSSRRMSVRRSAWRGTTRSDGASQCARARSSACAQHPFRVRAFLLRQHLGNDWLRRDLHPANHIRISAEPDLAGRLVERHVANRVDAIGRNRHRFHPRLLSRIERLDLVRLDSRLGYPDVAAIVDGHSV